MTFVNVVSPAYLKQYGELKDLRNHRLIHFVSGFAEEPDGFEYFDGQQSRQIKMKGLITVATIDAYKAAALAGLGIAQNPRIGVRAHLKSGRLVEVLSAYRPRPSNRVKIVYPHRRSLARRVRVFVEWVTPVLRRYFEGQDD